MQTISHNGTWLPQHGTSNNQAPVGWKSSCWVTSYVAGRHEQHRNTDPVQPFLPRGVRDVNSVSKYVASSAREAAGLNGGGMSFRRSLFQSMPEKKACRLISSTPSVPLPSLRDDAAFTHKRHKEMTEAAFTQKRHKTDEAAFTQKRHKADETAFT